MMANIDRFLQSLINFDKDNIPNENLVPLPFSEPMALPPSSPPDCPEALPRQPKLQRRKRGLQERRRRR